MEMQALSRRQQVLRVFLLAEQELLLNADVYAALNATERLEKLALCKVLVRLCDEGLLRLVSYRTRELTAAGMQVAVEALDTRTVPAVLKAATPKTKAVAAAVTQQQQQAAWWKDPALKPRLSVDFGWGIRQAMVNVGGSVPVGMAEGFNQGRGV